MVAEQFPREVIEPWEAVALDALGAEWQAYCRASSTWIEPDRPRLTLSCQYAAESVSVCIELIGEDRAALLRQAANLSDDA